MIPKKIHYVWVGGNEKPNFVEVCILSWKEKMPDYEIIEWNETNFPLEEEFQKSPFLKECYKRKLWAFVSDYMRVHVLEKFGGIYLDTDVYLVKGLSELCVHPVFLGFESESLVNAAVVGAIPNSSFFQKVLSFYREGIESTYIYTIPQVVSNILQREFSLLLNGKQQELLDGVAVYPRECFYPYYYNENYTPACIVENTYAIHWWSKSWGSIKGMEYLETKHLKFPKKQLKMLKLKWLRSA